MTQPTPQGEPPEQPTQPVAPVGPTADQIASAVSPAPEPTEEAFDKDRAMNTIKNLREFEKQAKKDLKELEQLKAEQQKRAEAEMTEAQRLQKQNEELASQYAKLQADMWRTKAATAANLPSIFADRIQGKTEEEMLEDAKKLAEALPKDTTKKPPPNINATNPSNANATETDAQKRERLFGKQGNVFDLGSIQEAGGGVIWKTNPNKE